VGVANGLAIYWLNVWSFCLFAFCFLLPCLLFWLAGGRGSGRDEEVGCLLVPLNLMLFSGMTGMFLHIGIVIIGWFGRHLGRLPDFDPWTWAGYWPAVIGGIVGFALGLVFIPAWMETALCVK
jgi:hypothetical protein